MTSARKITLTDTGEVFVGFETVEAAAQPRPRRYALLVFCDGEAQLQTLAADAAIVVGRDAPSEIVVDDASVSRQHARFVLRDGQVIAEDLDSRNGTFVRGERIRDRRLAPGDEVQVGRARIVLAATHSPEQADGEELPASDSEFVIRNARMKQLYEYVDRAARANVPVLILGETGCGKEHVARAVHLRGPRGDGPFVPVNCAAIPSGLVESTLFGHERGAFTGAAARSVGMFERASGGVLFLDEVGELSQGAQAALLRAIETRRICRVGGKSEISVDVRVVAATHCDLAAMIKENAFRQDLYFRLSGVVLEVPPLRERPDEIEPMIDIFLARACREWALPARRTTPEARQALVRYHWPGNVRQLRQAVERAGLLAEGDTVRIGDLPDYVAESGTRSREAAVFPPAITDLALDQQLLRYERLLIEEGLRRAGGNRQTAAKLLRIPVRTLFRRMRACGIGADKNSTASDNTDSNEAS